MIAGIRRETVNDLLPYSDNELWIGTESGIYIYNLRTAQFIHLRASLYDSYSLSDNAIYALYKDREEGLWIGSYFGGGCTWGPANVSAVLWPVLLVCVGIAFFYRPQCRKRERKIQSETDFTTRQHHSGDGFVRSDNVFGGVKQVVLDEVFKGAEIRNSFGGTVLDLRRTNIEQGETYIDVECNFGGVEIYVPLDWRVDLQANAFLGGCEDKRVPGVNIDQSRRLVVIGNVSFGGVEIKG